MESHIRSVIIMSNESNVLGSVWLLYPDLLGQRKGLLESHRSCDAASTTWGMRAVGSAREDPHSEELLIHPSTSTVRV
jgi:hypothetical protein